MRRRTLLKLLAALPLLGIGGAAGGLAVARSRNPYYSGPVTDHFDGTVFFVPDGEAPKGFAELLKWQLNGGRKAWPAR